MYKILIIIFCCLSNLLIAQNLNISGIAEFQKTTINASIEANLQIDITDKLKIELGLSGNRTSVKGQGGIIALHNITNKFFLKSAIKYRYYFDPGLLTLMPSMEINSLYKCCYSYGIGYRRYMNPKVGYGTVYFHITKNFQL